MIKKLPLTEQPREKLLTYGPQVLSDAELLAVFLRTGIKGKNAIELARELLNQCGGIRGLLQSQFKDIKTIKGLGHAKCAQLYAILAICQRYLTESLKAQPIFHNSADTKNFLKLKMQHLPHEVFAALFLDTRHALISYEQLFNGTINTTEVHTREVVKKALEYNAASLIIAHNHPSGQAKPSESDKITTQRLLEALKLMDIKLIDHIIIGKQEIYSFAEHGILGL